MKLNESIFEALSEKELSKVFDLVKGDFQYAGFSENGYTIVTECVLSAVISSDEIAFLRKVLYAGFDSNVINENGSTALNLAVSSQNYDIVELLVEYGAYVDADISEENCLLHGAAATGVASIFKLLLTTKFENSLEKKNEVDNTPLMTAVNYGNSDIVQMLLKNKIDLLSKDAFGNTALHLAAELKNKSIYHFLIKSGCDPKHVNNLRISAEEISKDTFEEPIPRPKPLSVIFKEHGI